MRQQKDHIVDYYEKEKFRSKIKEYQDKIKAEIWEDPDKGPEEALVELTKSDNKLEKAAAITLCKQKGIQYKPTKKLEFRYMDQQENY